MELDQNFDINKIINIITDPLSGKIFTYPVLADDGVVYEATELDIWKSNNGLMSPTTKKPLLNDALLVIPLKSFIDDLVEKCPSLKNHRYDNSSYLKSYSIHKVRISEIIANNNYNELKNYGNYSFVNMGSDILRSIFSNVPFDVVKHIVENSIDFNAVLNVSSMFNNEHWKITNFAAKYADLNTLKYIIERGGEINCESSINGYDILSPLHVAAIANKVENIKYLINSGANLLIKTSKGYTPFSFICQYCNEEMIKYCIEKLKTDNYDLRELDAKFEINNLQTNEDMDPIIMMEMANILSSMTS